MTILVPLCFANSAEPPSLYIVVINAPSDFQIIVDIDGNEYESYKSTEYKDVSFSFYPDVNEQWRGSYTLNLIADNKVETIYMGEDVIYHNTMHTLNYKDKTIIVGKSFSRTSKLTLARIFFTLIIEAIVFLIFGFRKKNSWLIFIAINLITQGALNIWLASFIPPYGYVIFALLFGEIIVFTVEILVFLVLVKEKNKSRTALYVVPANLLSLILGGYMIMWLL